MGGLKIGGYLYYSFAPPVVLRVPFDALLLERMGIWRRNIDPPPQITYVGVQDLYQQPVWEELCAHSRGRVHVNSLTAINGGTALAWGDQSVIESLGEDNEYSLAIAISPRILSTLNDTRQVMTVSLIFCNYVRILIQKKNLKIYYFNVTDANISLCHYTGVPICIRFNLYNATLCNMPINNRPESSLVVTGA